MAGTINISFFQKDGKFDINAIGMGVYIIELSDKHNHKIPLYIGESVWMIVRCAGHLYRTFKNPTYLGLIDELDNSDFELSISVLDSIDNKNLLAKREIERIEEINPLTQKRNDDKLRGKRDSMINTEEKIKRVQDAIKQINNRG